MLIITAAGTLAIEGEEMQAMYNNGGTVENSGTINIGATASPGSIGIENYGIFNNHAGGANQH